MKREGNLQIAFDDQLLLTLKINIESRRNLRLKAAMPCYGA